MENKGMAVCTDIYDSSGNLVRIEAHTVDDQFIIQGLWDTNDEQTSENRENFRAWFYRQLRNHGYKVS